MQGIKNTLPMGPAEFLEISTISLKRITALFFHVFVTHGYTVERELSGVKMHYKV